MLKLFDIISFALSLYFHIAVELWTTKISTLTPLTQLFFVLLMLMPMFMIFQSLWTCCLMIKRFLIVLWNIVKLLRKAFMLMLSLCQSCWNMLLMLRGSWSAQL
ncbi:TPA_asm: P overlapped [Primula alphacytorhabdovirus 1]|nr:TPA_asm: P overlapped [Primula alphacytorhabdovirus 1]